ncbi:MAG: cysteate synthase [Bacteroidetes bacterium]|nr:cysteate synthase [Bacteroidota bacterium]
MEKDFVPTSYRLQSQATGNIYDDTGWLLDPPGEDRPALLRAVYASKTLQLRGSDYGLYTFADWLPVKRMLAGSSAPVTWQSKEFGKHLGLNNLYITFSGWWPDRGALMRTCSFKETEAYVVGGRLTGSADEGVLVVASAGNTARSFAQVCSDNGIPLLLCVPQDNLDALWFESQLRPNVKLVATPAGSDYFDAIHLSNIIASLDGFFPEGGARNVARRDGMGTTFLSAVTSIGAIPDYYFQAVGSGTGAIAAWEANLRLIADGRYGNNKTRLMVSQNEPFLPMYQAWKAQSRQLPQADDDTLRRQTSEIMAAVLSNRKPPYGLAGGLFDALADSRGEVLKVSNDQAFAAAALFEKLEGIDIHPAAAVAAASLIQAVEQGMIEKDALIMLNITGGGEKLFRKQIHAHFLKPELILSPGLGEAEIAGQIRGLSW